MKLLLVTTLILATSILSLKSFAEERGWTDAASGREYLLLNGALTWNAASKACRDKGMAVSDLRYLSDDERKAFLKTDALKSLNWETRYPSTTREVQMGLLWQSAGIMTHATGSDPSYSALVLMKKKDVLSSTVEWRQGGVDTANAVCMAVPGFWHFCNGHFRCTEADGKFPMTTSYYDYGATTAEALRRIVERTQDPKVSITEMKCSLLTDRTHCYRELP